MLKIVFILLIAIFFISCGDSGDADFVINSDSENTVSQDDNETNTSSEKTTSQDDKLAKNPNYEIYDEECKQTDDAGLCGYVGTDGPPSLPCVDKTYCLPE
jgi:uncharacterized protein YpmS